MGSIHSVVQPRTLGPITLRCNQNLPPGQGGKTEEGGQNRSRFPFKISPFSKTRPKHLTPSSALIQAGCHSRMTTCLKSVFFFFRQANARNVERASLKLACDSLQWVNNNYDNNKDDVSIALLPPFMLFLCEQGIQATESPGELF